MSPTESGAMQAAGDFTLPAEHPALPGHFPGRPLVPGVVLLDHALALIRAASGAGHPAVLTGVKFTAPVLPGQRVTVRWRIEVPGRITFACDAEDVPVLHGSARFASSP